MTTLERSVGLWVDQNCLGTTPFCIDGQMRTVMTSTTATRTTAAIAEKTQSMTALVVGLVRTQHWYEPESTSPPPRVRRKAGAQSQGY